MVARRIVKRARKDPPERAEEGWPGAIWELTHACIAKRKASEPTIMTGRHIWSLVLAGPNGAGDGGRGGRRGGGEKEAFCLAAPAFHFRMSMRSPGDQIADVVV